MQLKGGFLKGASAGRGFERAGQESEGSSRSVNWIHVLL